MITLAVPSPRRFVVTFDGAELASSSDVNEAQAYALLATLVTFNPPPPRRFVLGIFERATGTNLSP